MVAMKEIEKVEQKSCRNPGCPGHVSLENANAVDFEGCACLDKVYPCDICGLAHCFDGRHIYKRDDKKTGVFYRNGKFVTRPINNK
jgi:hypothetical protein